MLAKALCQFFIRIVWVAIAQPEQQFVRLVRPRCIPGHNLGSQALAREIRLRKATPATEHLKLVLGVREQSWWVATALIPRVGNSRADVRPTPLPVKLVTFLSASA